MANLSAFDRLEGELALVAIGDRTSVRRQDANQDLGLRSVHDPEPHITKGNGRFPFGWHHVDREGNNVLANCTPDLGIPNMPTTRLHIKGGGARIRVDLLSNGIVVWRDSHANLRFEPCFDQAEGVSLVKAAIKN